MTAAAPQVPLSESLGEDIHFAVDKTLTQMFATSVTSAFKSVPPNQAPTCEVTAVLPLIQATQIQGALVVSFPQTTLFALLKKFYKKDFATVDKPVKDAVGELANIIFGSFKQRTRTKNMIFKMAIPTIAPTGAHGIMNVSWALAGEFKCEHGPFYVLLLGIGAPAAAAS